MEKSIELILKELKEPFPASAHKDRDLPGGGRWFYIPWQLIRDRLDEVCPDWQVSYSHASYVGDFCCILCTITIAGVSRQAPGNAPIVQLSNKGNDMSRGSPIERATADAFKNAAEAFGVGRYLDNQSFVVKLMQSQGDGRGVQFAYRDNKKASPPKLVIPPTPEIYRKKLSEAIEAAKIDIQTMRRIASSILGRQIKTADDIKSDQECDQILEAILNASSVTPK